MAIQTLIRLFIMAGENKISKTVMHVTDDIPEDQEWDYLREGNHWITLDSNNNPCGSQMKRNGIQIIGSGTAELIVSDSEEESAIEQAKGFIRRYHQFKIDQYNKLAEHEGRLLKSDIVVVPLNLYGLNSEDMDGIIDIDKE